MEKKKKKKRLRWFMSGVFNSIKLKPHKMKIKNDRVSLFFIYLNTIHTYRIKHERERKKKKKIEDG